MVAKVSALHGFKADLHEMVITPEGTAIISIYHTIMVRDEQNRRTYIWDCLFQEIDIESKELVFQWRASDHHKPEESFTDRGDGGSRSAPWDWYHLNSVQKDEFGNYLISARYTHTVTYIHGMTGEIIWVLGGKRNMFEDLSGGSATNFGSQHHAHMHPLTTFPNLLKKEIKLYGANVDESGVKRQLISMFDNGRDDKTTTHKTTRGLLVEITYPDMSSAPSTESRSNGHGYTVREIKSYDHPEGVSSESQGSLQVIPSVLDGHDPKVLLGYGHKAIWTEFSAEGDVICDTHFATEVAMYHYDAQTYRVLKFPWVGLPDEPPVATLSVQSSLFVSWNGATEVNSWVLQHTNSSIDFNAENKMQVSWEDYDTVGRQKFETEIELYCDARRYLRVLALDKNDNIIGTSNTVDLGPLSVRVVYHHQPMHESLANILPQVISRVRPDVDADVHETSPMKVTFYFDTAPTASTKFLVVSLFSISFLCFLYAGYSKFMAPERGIRGKGFDRINSVSSAAESV